MKSIAKIICCGVALAWMCSATAREDAVDTTSDTDGDVTEATSATETGSALPTGGSSSVLTQVAAGGAAPAPTGATGSTSTAAAGGGAPAPAAVEDAPAVPTPPAPRVVVKPYHDKVDRTKVEKRIETNAAQTKKRSADAEKDAAERAAKAQQGQ